MGKVPYIFVHMPTSCIERLLRFHFSEKPIFSYRSCIMLPQLVSIICRSTVVKNCSTGYLPGHIRQ